MKVLRNSFTITLHSFSLFQNITRLFLFNGFGSKVEIVFETLLLEIPHQIVLNRTFDSKFLFDISSEMIKTHWHSKRSLFQNFLFNLSRIRNLRSSDRLVCKCQKYD